MISKPIGFGAGQNWAFWPLLLILLMAVLIPTACVLWFMNAAISNEHLAVRQRLMIVYSQQLADAQTRIETYWAKKLKAFDDVRGMSAAQTFETLTRTGVADAVIVHDASGEVAYPQVGRGLSSPATTPQWESAQSLERDAAYSEASKAYGKIANSGGNPDCRAQAWQAKGRCLVQLGHKDEAIEVLVGVLSRAEYRSARDRWERFIVPDALMHALHLSQPRESEQWQRIKEELLVRVNNYKKPAMPSAQRRFLMMALQQETGVSLPMLDAERLAAEYLDADIARPAGSGIRPMQSANLWTLTSSDGGVVGLFREATVADLLASSEPDISSLAGAELVTHYGPDSDETRRPFVSIPVGPSMPSWNMSLYLDDPELFTAAARRQNAIYLWTGGAGVLAIVVFSLAIATYIGRQIRLTHLKNNLIATVSHELKTPLASMRVLVDTLREGRCISKQQRQEYFELIAKENERLSRLIDSFLTFSRMERNRRAFEFVHVDVGDVVRAAVDAVSERFASPESQLEVVVDDMLPEVWADEDAMMTAILNLLDNAWKYSGDHKLIRVRAYTCKSSVIIEVRDNGTGMSRRVTSRIFDKFYQVDQTLSRKAGGCGLGLSIVKFILDAHGGTVGVDSKMDEGSTFTIQLPAADKQESIRRTE